jgi:hypothetical protein
MTREEVTVRLGMDSSQLMGGLRSIGPKVASEAGGWGTKAAQGFSSTFMKIVGGLSLVALGSKLGRLSKEVQSAAEDPEQFKKKFGDVSGVERQMAVGFAESAEAASNAWDRLLLKITGGLVFLGSTVANIFKGMMPTAAMDAAVRSILEKTAEFEARLEKEKDERGTKALIAFQELRDGYEFERMDNAAKIGFLEKKIAEYTILGSREGANNEERRYYWASRILALDEQRRDLMDGQPGAAPKPGAPVAPMTPQEARDNAFKRANNARDQFVKGAQDARDSFVDRARGIVPDLATGRTQDPVITELQELRALITSLTTNDKNLKVTVKDLVKP